MCSTTYLNLPGYCMMLINELARDCVRVASLANISFFVHEKSPIFDIDIRGIGVDGEILNLD